MGPTLDECDALIKTLTDRLAVAFGLVVSPTDVPPVPDRGDVDDDDRDDRDEHPDWDEDEDPCPDCGEPAGLGHASDCGVAAMMLADMVAGDDATAIDRVLADPAAQALSLDSPADRDRLRELLVAALAGGGR